MQRLYCDGGVIRKNPSPFGGTWAWILVEEMVSEFGDKVDQIIDSAAGYISPDQGEGGLVTNNIAELFAAVEGLRALPRPWTGHFYSDSQVTIGRLFWGWRYKNVPDWLYRAVGPALKGLVVEPHLLQGHPTLEDLSLGIGKKRNLPVSVWNKWCDTACQNVAASVERDLRVAEAVLAEVDAIDEAAVAVE